MGCGASNATEVAPQPLSLQQNWDYSRCVTRTPGRTHTVSPTENGKPTGLQFSDSYSSMIPDFQTPVETLNTNWNVENGQESTSNIERFVTELSEDSIGRDSVLSSITSYINNPSSQVPLLLHSGAGKGKTTVLAKIVTSTARDIQQKLQSG